MLKPAMKDLMDKVGNRYLLVNLAAARARDLSMNDEENLTSYEKPVKLALEDIVNGKIELCEPSEENEETLSFETASDDVVMMQEEDEVEQADIMFEE